MGTYNYYSPHYKGGLLHGFYDVLPYYIMGNTPEDMVMLNYRIEATIRSLYLKSINNK